MPLSLYLYGRFLLALASTAVFRSQSHRTHDHIFCLTNPPYITSAPLSAVLNSSILLYAYLLPQECVCWAVVTDSTVPAFGRHVAVHVY
jgi:hypothetical protein